MTDRSVRVHAASPVPASVVEGAKHDFACAYEIAVLPGDNRSSEEWAREIWEGAPASLRFFITAGWRLVLRLRLGPMHSQEHILGWRILNRSNDETICQLDSDFLNAHNIFRRVDQTFVWSTFVSYKRPRARVIWPPVSLVHRLLARITLRRAAAVGSNLTNRSFS